MNMMERLYSYTDKPELRPTTLIAPVRIPESQQTPESLSSYITRLAQAHLVSVGVIVTQFIQPRITSQQKGHLLHRCTDGYAINGAGFIGCEVHNAVKSMVAPSESTAFYSFHFLGNLIGDTYKNLLSKQLKWCSSCVAENSENYYPLYWQCQSVGCCAKHETTLESACPHCGQTQQTLTATSVTGKCSTCNLQLRGEPSNTQRATKKQLWMANNVNQLITEQIHLSNSKLITNFRLNLKTSCTLYGSVQNAERQLGFTKTRFQNWLTRNRPNFPDFLELCYRLNTSPIDYISPPRTPQEHACYVFPSPTPKQRKKKDRAQIENRLQHAAEQEEAISIKALSRELKTSVGYLQYHFQDHLDVITANRKAYLDDLKKTQRENLVTEAADIALQLLAQCKYFGGKNMAITLSDKVGFKKLTNKSLIDHWNSHKSDFNGDIATSNDVTLPLITKKEE